MNKGVATKAIAGLGFGFLVGAVIGFTWGQKTKSRVGESVDTSYHRGRLTVEVDAYKMIGFR